MPKLVKLVVYGLLYTAFFLVWMVSIQIFFGINDISKFDRDQNLVAWGVPFLVLLISPLLYRAFGRRMDAWNESMKEAQRKQFPDDDD